MASTVIYCRISDDREGRELGVQRQEEDCRARADRQGLEVAEVFVDNDISASTNSRKSRPEYDRMIDGVRSGEIGTVIAYKNSRLTRRPRELEDWIDLHAATGVLILTVMSGDDDLSTASGRMLARIKASYDAGQAEETSELVQRALKQRKQQGLPPGGQRPYGWLPDRVHLDPAEHAVICEVAERALAGETLRGLATVLNRREVPTVTGAPWSSTVLRRILTLPHTIGFRATDGEPDVRGVWEPALDESTWRQLRALLLDPARTTVRTGRVNLLPGIARCGECDRPMGSRKGGRGQWRYACLPCGLWRVMRPVDDYVEGAVVAYLEQLEAVPDPGVDPAVQARCQMLRDRIGEANEAFADDDTISPGEHREIVRRLKARLVVEERKLLPPRRSRLVRDLTGPGAGGLWPGLPLDRRRAVIAELLEVRLLRVGRGQRVFRPETVELVRR